MKRIFPIFLCLCICLSVFAFSVSAKEVNGRTVLDYMDYVTAYDLFNPTDGWAYISFGANKFTAFVNDANGFSGSGVGTRLMRVSIPNDETPYQAHALSEFPGGFSNNTFLAVDNIPSGSKMWIQAIGDTVGLESHQAEILIKMNSGVSYYDANFNWIRDDYSESKFYSFYTSERFNQIIELPLNKPDNAAYCSFYTRVNFGVGQSSEQTPTIDINFQFSDPNLKISTSYTQILIEGIVNARPPEGNDTILDVDDVEDYLAGATGDGKDLADTVMDEAPDLLTLHLSGFLFMATVIDILVSAGWIRGVLIVSLSLGIFGYLTNLVSDAGSAVERRGSLKRSFGKSKGG